MARGEWPLVGRAEELRLLSAVQPGAGSPGGVVLAGAAGVGKTRLARESCARAERRGAVTHWATATASARSIPLGAFELTADVLGADPTQVLHRAISALEARTGTVLLAVDDAHLLDELSATLLHQVVLRGLATVVATVRSGEPAPDAVTALWKDGHLPRLEVQPLSAEETAALLEARLGGPVDTATASGLHAITQGNPLYLRHLVDEELAADRLHEEAGLWRWTGRPTLSAGLTDLLALRIGALSAAERDVIDVLAFGEPLEVSLLAELTDPDAVERAELRGLVGVSPHGDHQARLAHPLYGELRRTECGALRARRLRGRITTALADDPAIDDPIRLATLMQDSDLTPDPDVLASGARRALELADCGLAETLARASIAAGGRFEPRLDLSMALSWMQRGAEADEELAALAGLAADDAERSRVAVPRVANLLFTLADPAEAERSLVAAKASVSDRVPVLELDAIGSVLDGFRGRVGRGAGVAAAVLADPCASDDAVILAAWGLTACGGELGRIDGLADAVARIQPMTGSPNVGVVRVGSVGATWLRALRLAGTLDEAARFAARAVATHGTGMGPLRPMVLTWHGEVAIEVGQVRTALRRLREADGPVLPPGWPYLIRLFQVAPSAMVGDLATARTALAAAEAERHPSLTLFDPELTLARAWVAAAEGALTEALEHAHRAAAQAASTQQYAVEVVALHTAVQFGDRTLADRLTDLATRVDGPRAPAAAAHAAALAADDGDALTAAAEQIEAFGALLIAMDAAAQATLAYHRHHQRGSAHAALARAQRLATACENPTTPALLAAATPLPLTEREREIATLAAAGLTNRQIADRLTVSVRTVEGHLYRANTKLGTTTRAELTTLLTGR
jgi:DNA-binding NarL/FixJ family response regulator